ncbi:MAG: hypothetical protein DHS20C05_03290 [Hyphococcus sp.]|nr:MAG: hypothetical protein DHS20C05_03290 [Marinicaulis sp.]
MFKKFSGSKSDGAWPMAKIIEALKKQYGAVDTLGEDGPLKVYGVQHNGVNFVVALMQSAPASGQIVELGFLARFVGFAVDTHLIEQINRNLHISVAALEGPDLFLMAGLQVTGSFDEGQFSLVMEAWRRDLMVTLHGLSNDQHSMVEAYPVAKMAAARDFAMNVAPEGESVHSFDMLSAFLGGNSAKEVCGECAGRGKRGFIARICNSCEGEGFISHQRH